MYSMTEIPQVVCTYQCEDISLRIIHSKYSSPCNIARQLTIATKIVILLLFINMEFVNSS